MTGAVQRADEMKTRNFSIYGQWCGILCILLCFALGISNIFTIHPLVIPFSVVCLICAIIIIFIEIPLLLRICPTSPKFDTFIRKFETNYMRASIYGVMSVVQWVSIWAWPTSLIAAAIVLMFAGLLYALAGLKGQAFQGSKALGGAGVAQMII
ncbi:Golgi apparatus membrane protein TVP18 [Massarina eburnea CBS 473.64]|uniref:Golgi apparatus membrane protein TVP18 n=1 Tax=Massarina eburnea CBS 473.64 TaxID=1395130 RepID=A0A6A6SC00_9PLEO|nr:Golgi apparatus membrane protein TVP18 [Massarina eburnea CBS 473.64]